MHCSTLTKASWRTGLFYAIIALAIALAGRSAPGLAQTYGEAPQPAVRQSVDDNGVDVLQGLFVASFTDLTIGPATKNGLSFQRISGIGGVNTLIGVIEVVGGTYVVTLDGVSDSFTQSGSSFISVQGNGATLVNSSGTYVYTSRDGTVARFASNAGYTYSFYQNDFARLGSITYPDGSTTTFTLKVQTICPGGYEGNVCQSPLQYVSRLQSANNSNGYQLKFTYALNTTKIDGDNYASWGTITQVTAINNAVEYCAPSADTCSLSNPWPSATFSGGTVTDPLGRTNPGTGKYTVGYDANYRVASITRNGVTHTYAYSDSGTTRTTTVTDGNGGHRIYVGDTGTLLLASVQNELGRTTSYSYDSNGRLTQTTFPEGNAVQYSYDARGNATQALYIAKPGSGLANTTTSAAFPASCSNPKTCNKPTSTTDARGQTTSYTYDPNHGGVLTVTLPADASGVQPQTRYSYTALQAYYLSAPGTISASAFPIYVPTGISTCLTTASCTGTADESVTSIGYGAQNGTANNLLPVTIIKAAGNGAISATTAATYDNIGNVLTVDGPLPGTADTTRLRYDADRELVGVVGPDPDGSGSLTPAAVKYSYNSDGIMWFTSIGTVTDQSDSAWANFTEAYHNFSLIDGNDRTIRTTFGANGTDNGVSDYLYDALGRLSCAIVYMDPSRWGPQATTCTPLQTNGPNGADRVTQAGYDAASEPTSIISGVGTANQRTEAAATYTPNGKTASATDGKSNLTTYAYDGFDRLSQVNYPSKTTTNQASTTDYEVYGYDAAGNRTFRRLRDGRAMTFAYDNLGRIVTKSVPTGCAPIQVGACAPASATRSVYYGYTLTGQQTYARFDSASGSDGVTAVYDALGRQTSSTIAMSGTSRTLAYQYDAAGNRTQILHPDGVHFDTSFDPLSRMTGATWWAPASGTVPFLALTFDSLGRRTGINRASSYTYYAFDGVSRLNSQAQQFAGGTGNLTEGLGYSPANQIVSRSRNNDDFIATSAVAVNRPYATNGLNQYTVAGSATFTYDADGNLVSDGTNTYVYDAENRLVSSSANGMSLTYDPLGRLWQTVSSALGTTQFLTDGGHVVLEYDGSNTVRRRFMWGPGADEPILEDEGGAMNCSGTNFLHTDHTGSIIAVANCWGNRTNVNGYDEFGIPNSNNYGRFQYTGQAWLADLGMYYYKARIYSPTLGRFMQTDPIGYSDGLNGYNYVHGDPVNNADSSGLCSLVSTYYYSYDPNDGSYTYLFANFAYFDCDRSEGKSGNTDTGAGSGGGVDSASTEIVVMAKKPKATVADCIRSVINNNLISVLADASSIVPGGGDLADVARLGAGVASLTIAYATGSKNGKIIGSAGVVTGAVQVAANRVVTSAPTAKAILEAIPVVGSLVAFLATANDINEAHDAYQACTAGK